MGQAPRDFEAQRKHAFSGVPLFAHLFAHTGSKLFHSVPFRATKSWRNYWKLLNFKEFRSGWKGF